MKHITLLLAALLATQITFAQEEVAIEQNISQRITKLEINQGWDVHLIHHEAGSGYRVAVITEEDLAARAYNVQLCNVKDQSLTILENTQLPKGTVVEIEGPMTFEGIHLMDKSTAEADYIVASAQKETTNLYLGKDTRLHIQHYHIPSLEYSAGADLWDRAQLTIDTLSGVGNAWVNVYGGAEFRNGTNNLLGKIKLQEYEVMDNWPYQHKETKVIKTKKVDGELVTTEHRKMWNEALHVEAGFGIRQGDTPKDPNSPLLQSSTLSIRLGLNTYYKLSNHWGFSTGLFWNHNKKSLCHQVKYENNELVVIDGQGDFQRDRLNNDYLGIPITLYYYLGKQHTESFSLDLYGARLLGERLSTSADPTRSWGIGWTAISVDNIFNPWKLEAGLSFNTQHLGFIHGIRVFTNLLPEYKPGVTTDKIRSIGLEIKL